MAQSGTGAFALGGTLLVLCFFVDVSGWGHGTLPSQGVVWALLVAGLALCALGIWRIFHSHLPFRARAEGPVLRSEAGQTEG